MPLAPASYPALTAELLNGLQPKAGQRCQHCCNPVIHRLPVLLVHIL